MLLSVIDHLLNCIGDTRGSSCRRTEALVTTNRLVSTCHQRSQISLGDNRPMHLLNSAGGWPACSFLPNRIKPSGVRAADRWDVAIQPRPTLRVWPGAR